MSGQSITDGGIEYDAYEPDEIPPNHAYAILLISGEYSGIMWSVEAIADTLDAARAYIDAHPPKLPSTKWSPADRYEVHLCERVPLAATEEGDTNG